MKIRFFIDWPMMVVAIFVLVAGLLMASCTHAPYGAHELESGSKIVDKGADRTYKDYVESYKFISQHCKEDIGCMKYWNVTPAQYKKMTKMYEEVKRRQEAIDDDIKEIRKNIDEMEVLTNHVLEVESTIIRIQP